MAIINQRLLKVHVRFFRQPVLASTQERIGRHGLNSELFPTNQGDFEVYVEAADGTSRIPDEGPFRQGHIVVRKGSESILDGNHYWTVPFWQGDDALVALWKDVTVPTCVKNCVERLHSQHRRLAI